MKMKVAFLNCKSHGDCSVITFKENYKKACIVIDGGENKKSAGALSDYLKKENIRTINLLIGTHIDSDHINGLKYFVKDQADKKENGDSYVDIDGYWGAMPSENHAADYLPELSGETDEPDYKFSWQSFVIQSVKQNDDLIEELNRLGVKISYPAIDNVQDNPFNNIDIKLLNPDTQIPSDSILKKAMGIPDSIEINNEEINLSEFISLIEDHYEKMAIEAKRNANNQSIVVKIRLKKAKEWSFLFTGDAEEEAWESMLDNGKVSKYLRSKVLKIPHHGSGKNGISIAGIKKVKPEYSINLVGQKHGLPDEDLLTEINSIGSSIFCPIRNQSSNHKSACFNVSASECPAKNNSSDIEFVIDSKTGDCEIFPQNRKCKHNWA